MVFTDICPVFYLVGDERYEVGACAALTTVYWVLFTPMFITYIRLLVQVNVNPGYVPLGPAAIEQRKRMKNKKAAKADRTHQPKSKSSDDGYSREYTSTDTALAAESSAIPRDEDPDSPGLELFYSRRIFVCTSDGKPKWCTQCGHWKPDRTHHCSDVGRCVYKMDHYCPWVGGVVGENSFKFFVQFVFYAFLYCAFIVIGCAIYLADDIQNSRKWDREFAAIIGIAGFFGLFCLGMSCSSLHFAFTNLTTVENLSKKTKSHLLAVQLPAGYKMPDDGQPHPTITYPLEGPTPHETINGTSGGNPTNSEKRDALARKTFAILQLAPGLNPWDLGWKKNFTSVMGHKPWDWLLPIKRSPLTVHESDESWFEFGRHVEELEVLVGFKSMKDVTKPKPASAGKGAKGENGIEMNHRPKMTAEGIPRMAVG
jgi:palmitoyltransferase